MTGAGGDSSASPARVRFGPFEADLKTDELWRQDDLVPLAGKPFDVLAFLLRRPGELVSRSQLRRSLWPAASAADADKSLNAAVKKIRQALNDSPEAPRFVETLRGRGYRLIVEVSHAADDPTSTIRARRRSAIRGRMWIPMVLVVLALAPGAAIIYQHWFTPKPAEPDSRQLRLAVLPLASIGTGDTGSYLAEALTEEMTTGLGRMSPQHLAVVGRASVRGLDKPSVAEITKQLDLDYLVEGSVVDGGDKPRLHLRLVTAPDGAQIWAQIFEAEAESLPVVLAELRGAVQQALSLPEAPTLGAAATTASSVASRLYSRGLVMSQTRTWEAVATSRTLFEQAVAHDPDYAPAHLMLARQAWRQWMGKQSPRQDHLMVAESSVARALELAPDLAEAHALLAEIRLRASWDWSGAAGAFQRALAFAPADSRIRHRHAWFLLAAGRHQLARQEMAQALALDPMAADLYSDLGWFHYRAGDFTGALEHCGDALALDGKLAPAVECRFRALAHLQRFHEAREVVLGAMAALAVPEDLVQQVTEASPEVGYTHFFRWLAESRAESVSPFIAAMDAAALADHERAIVLLTRAIDEHDPYVTLLAVTPELDSLSADPRFIQLRRRIGFEDL
jgi:DNA-binding winged helix-turn-helix (wHTH) protein/TolB-like protein/Tfp pilus assembly protein PilF